MSAQPSHAVQNYLKVIHHLVGDDHVVFPADIASELRVRAPSVTGMLKRLAEAGWIEYESGAGARLTEKGRTEARRVIRRHRLVELFLTRVLGLDWSEVDAEAEALEHAISPRLEEAIAAHLGEPLEDPHGHPIPTSAGELTRRKLDELVKFPPGTIAVIREVRDDDSSRLRQWRAHGLMPGAVVRIVRYEKLDDLFEIEVNGRAIQLGSEGLVGLRAEPKTRGVPRSMGDASGRSLPANKRRKPHQARSNR